MDQAVEDAGPCPALPLPPKSAFHGAALSKKRIVVKSRSAYFYSEDLGQTWLPLQVDWGGAKTSETDDSTFAIDPANPERIVLATCEGAGDQPAPTDYRLVIRSRASSVAPFTVAVSTAPCYGHKLAISLERDQPSTVYYRATANPLTSTDGGKSWAGSTSFQFNSVGMPEGGFIHMQLKAGSPSMATLKVSPGGAAGVLSPKGSFAVSDTPSGSALLQGGSGKFLFAHGNEFFASVDGGASFKPIARPEVKVLVPIEVASRDGKTLWAIDGRLRVAMSSDGGLTWSTRHGGLPPFSPEFPQPRISVHPYNDTSVLIRDEEFFSTYDQFRIATTDGFSTSDARNEPTFQAWASAVGFLAANAGAHFVLNGNGALKGTATAAPPELLPLPPSISNIWSPFPDILSLPSAPNALFFGANDQGSKHRYETYDLASGAKRDLNPAAAMKVVGHAISHTSQGPRLLIISPTGRVRQTTDGLTFVDSSPDPLFPSCERRLLSASRLNPARMVTACLGSKEHGINLTVNGGKDWTHIPAADLQDCSVTQIVVTDLKTIASCSASRKVFEIAR